MAATASRVRFSACGSRSRPKRTNRTDSFFLTAVTLNESSSAIAALLAGSVRPGSIRGSTQRSEQSPVQLTHLVPGLRVTAGARRVTVGPSRRPKNDRGPADGERVPVTQMANDPGRIDRSRTCRFESRCR